MKTELNLLVAGLFLAATSSASATVRYVNMCPESALPRPKHKLRQNRTAKAEGIIAQEPQRQAWQEADLLARRKHDAVKLEIAARLKGETTLSTKAIATRVHLGSSKAGKSELAPKHARGHPSASVGQGQLGKLATERAEMARLWVAADRNVRAPVVV